MIRIALVLLLLSGLAFGQHSVVLTCTASPTPSVSYNFYRSSASGGPYTLINLAPVVSCGFTDVNVALGATYFYTVRAFDGFVESVNSNEAKAVIPQAPLPPTGLQLTVR